MLHRATQYITEWGASINLDLNSLPKPMDLLNDYAGTIGGAATNFLTQLPRIGLNLAVFIFALFFFLIESKKIRRFFSGLDILSETEISKITGVIKRSSFITIVASVSIAFIQALIISLAAVMVGYSDFFLIFIITFVFPPPLGNFQYLQYFVCPTEPNGQCYSQIVRKLAAIQCSCPI